MLATMMLSGLGVATALKVPRQNFSKSCFSPCCTLAMAHHPFPTDKHTPPPQLSADTERYIPPPPPSGPGPGSVTIPGAQPAATPASGEVCGSQPPPPPVYVPARRGEGPGPAAVPSPVPPPAAAAAPGAAGSPVRPAETGEAGGGGGEMYPGGCDPSPVLSRRGTGLVPLGLGSSLLPVGK